MVEIEKVCDHDLQHAIRANRQSWVQYCVSCKEVLFGSGKNGGIRKNDQKVANQHKCFTKKTHTEMTVTVDNQTVSYDFKQENSK